MDSFDFVTHMTKRSWVPRRQKKFKHASYDDIEYMNKPLMSEQEKMVYRNSQHLPPSFFSKKDLSMEYGTILESLLHNCSSLKINLYSKHHGLLL